MPDMPDSQRFEYPGIIDINIYVIPQMRFVPQTFYSDI
jgi:hypothetical protein